MIELDMGFDCYAFGEDRPLIIGGVESAFTIPDLLPILMVMSPYMP